MRRKSSRSSKKTTNSTSICRERPRRSRRNRRRHARSKDLVISSYQYLFFPVVLFLFYLMFLCLFIKIIIELIRSGRLHNELKIAGDKTAVNRNPSDNRIGDKK